QRSQSLPHQGCWGDTFMQRRTNRLSNYPNAGCVFTAGYGELPEVPHRDRRTLKKPFQMDGLKQVLQSALDSIERTKLGCSLPPINADSSVVARFHRAC